jgi:hypothetical protein
VWRKLQRTVDEAALSVGESADGCDATEATPSAAAAPSAAPAPAASAAVAVPFASGADVWGASAALLLPNSTQPGTCEGSQPSA